MKKKQAYLLPFFLVVSIAANAQFKKGMRMVGAQIASVIFNSGSSDITVAQIGSNKSKITNYNVSISPSMGWFISDNTVVGAVVNINPYGSKVTYEQNGTTYQSDKTSSFNVGLGGFARFYLSKQNTLIPFAQVGVNGGISSLGTEGFYYGGSGVNAYKESYDGDSNGGIFFNSTFQFGATKKLNESTGLDFFIGYNFSYNKNTFKKNTLIDNGNNGTIDETRKNETTTKFTNHGFLLGIGFQIFLKGNSK